MVTLKVNCTQRKKADPVNTASSNTQEKIYIYMIGVSELNICMENAGKIKNKVTSAKKSSLKCNLQVFQNIQYI